ncbi:MAG: DUF4923 family protein [Muribaculaceae bacterium]|nr:DUF4923 family protein [Muribaculaceae bacterium]
MKRIMTILCVLAALIMTAGTSCSSSRHNTRDLNPDEVFTITDKDIVNETWMVNRAISGTWKYNGPSVGVSGKNLLAGVAKPIAKSKLKKKLKKAFKKIGLDKVRPEFSFNPDGTCSIGVMGTKLKGNYNYNPDTESISIKWHGVPLNAKLHRDGKKKLHLTFDADRLLKLISLMGHFSDSTAIKALSTLLDNYDDVMVGFELKK